MKITETYSHLDEKEVRMRNQQLGGQEKYSSIKNEDEFRLFQQFLEWRRKVK
jgi:hypothetical protein